MLHRTLLKQGLPRLGIPQVGINASALRAFTPRRHLFEKPVQTEAKPKQPEGPDLYGNHPILKRIPKILRPYTTRFIHAPVSHATAFVVLHELTAIVPLVGIWYTLHQYHDVLMGSGVDLPNWAIEKGTKVIDAAMAKWDWGSYSVHEKVQFVMEGAYAYVIVKALFPVRVAVSLLGMPWFAKWFVLPITGLFGRKGPKTPVKPQEPVAQPKKVAKPRL